MRAAPAHQQSMQELFGENLIRKEQIAMLLYPGFTALDLAGPHNVLEDFGAIPVNRRVVKDRNILIAAATTPGRWCFRPNTRPSRRSTPA